MDCTIMVCHNLAFPVRQGSGPELRAFTRSSILPQVRLRNVISAGGVIDENSGWVVAK